MHLGAQTLIPLPSITGRHIQKIPWSCCILERKWAWQELINHPKHRRRLCEGKKKKRIKGNLWWFVMEAANCCSHTWGDPPYYIIWDFQVFDRLLFFMRTSTWRHMLNPCFMLSSQDYWYPNQYMYFQISF